jgi:hypothetical protein
MAGLREHLGQGLPESGGTRSLCATRGKCTPEKNWPANDRTFDAGVI